MDWPQNPLAAIVTVVAIVGCLVFAGTWLSPRAMLEHGKVPSDTTRLDLEKARLEVEDKRYGWFRTIATALLTVAVAVGGWYLDRSKAREDIRQRNEALDRQTFAQFLGDLGDNNATKRIAAADYVTNVYVVPLTSGAEKRQILDALAYRLSVEEDPGVQEAVRGHLVEIAHHSRADALSVMRSVSDIDRRLSYAYASALGTAVGKRVARTYRTPADKKQRLAAGMNMHDPRYDAAALRTAMAIARGTPFILPFFNFVGPTMHAYDVTYGEDQDLSGVFERAFRDAVLRYELTVHAPATNENDHTLTSAAFGLSACGALFRPLIDAITEGPSSEFGPRGYGINLNGTFMPPIDLSGVNMSGVQWRNAIVTAHFDGTTIDFADLSGSNFTYADFTSSAGSGTRTIAHFDASNVASLGFLDAVYTRRRTPPLVTFDGSNIRDAEFSVERRGTGAASDIVMYDYGQYAWRPGQRRGAYERCRALSAPRPCAWRISE